MENRGYERKYLSKYLFSIHINHKVDENNIGAPKIRNNFKKSSSLLSIAPIICVIDLTTLQ